MGLTRQEAHQRLDGERTYQDALPSNRTNGASKSVGEYLTMMRHYMSVADCEWTTKAGDEAALIIIRKVGGIALHCIEDHGCPPR